MAHARVHVEALRAALDAQRRAREMSWRDVAKAVGVSPSTMTRLSNGLRPDADGFASMVSWLGVPAENFIESPDSEPPNDDAPQSELMVEVRALLRSRKELDEKDADMLTAVLEAAYAHRRNRPETSKT